MPTYMQTAEALRTLVLLERPTERCSAAAYVDRHNKGVFFCCGGCVFVCVSSGGIRVALLGDGEVRKWAAVFTHDLRIARDRIVALLDKKTSRRSGQDDSE